MFFLTTIWERTREHVASSGSDMVKKSAPMKPDVSTEESQPTQKDPLGLSWSERVCENSW